MASYDYATHLWKDAAGVTHRVLIVEDGRQVCTIQYIDNAVRGRTFYHGREYNHGTRRRVVVWKHELRALPKSDTRSV